MTPEERKQKLDALANQLRDAYHELVGLMQELPLECDRNAVVSISTDLLWAAVNCGLMGSHQIGEALDDCPFRTSGDQNPGQRLRTPDDWADFMEGQWPITIHD